LDDRSGYRSDDGHDGQWTTAWTDCAGRPESMTGGWMRKSLLCASLLAAACAPAVQQQPTPQPVEPAAVEVPLRQRYAVRPERTTSGFERAVERGPRTEIGHPGPAYWQQRAEYRIEAVLDPENALVRAEEAGVSPHNSPDTLTSILMHVYQNAFSEGVQRVRRVPVTGGTTLRRVAVNNVEAREGRGPAGVSAYRVDGTLMWIDLARP